MPIGRPSSFTQEIADKICELIEQGKSLRQISEIEGMPCKATIMNWCNEKRDFLDQYVRAKEEQAEYLADEILEIADNARNDWMEINAGDDIGFKLNGEHVQRSRLRIDTRKWLAGKLKPKKYGDYTRVDGDLGLTVVKIVDMTGKKDA